MTSEKVICDVADNPGEVASPQTSSMAESGVDIAYEKKIIDRKSTRLNSSHLARSRMPSSA